MLGFDPFSEFPLASITGVTLVGVSGISATRYLGSVSVIGDVDAPVVGTGAQTYLGSETVNAGASFSPTGLSATLYLGIVNGNTTQVNAWIDIITTTSGVFVVDEGPMFGGASFSGIPLSSITQSTHSVLTPNTWVDVDVAQLPNWYV